MVPERLINLDVMRNFQNYHGRLLLSPLPSLRDKSWTYHRGTERINEEKNVGRPNCGGTKVNDQGNVLILKKGQNKR